MEGYLRAYALGEDPYSRLNRLSNALRDLESNDSEKFFTESPEDIRAAAIRIAAEKLEKDRQEAIESEAKERERAKSVLAAEKEMKRRGGVRIGMSMKQVRASNWGVPESVNRTTTGNGVDEQWVYGTGSYLYFRNGKLTAIQN
jgi:hypothetical protein